MSKKDTSRRKRLEERRLKRRISQAIEFGFIIGVLILEIVIGRLPDTPNWFFSPLYYGLLFGTVIAVFCALIIWIERGEKSEVEELEDKLEQLIKTQTQSINRLTNEIRKDRKRRKKKDGTGNSG